MLVRNKMWFLIGNLIWLRRSMDLSMERRKIRVMTENSFNVGYVTRITTRRIACCTRVVDLRFIMLKRCKQLGILDKEFLGSMQHLITRKRITKLTLLIWKGTFVIKLFPFN